MRRLLNVAQYEMLPDGNVIPVSEGGEAGPRVVTLRFNSTKPAVAWLLDGDNKILLGAFEYMEEFEFPIEGKGPAHVYVLPEKGGEVWFFANKPEELVGSNSEPFVKLPTGRVRNPQLEAIQYQLRKSQELFEARVLATQQEQAAAMAAYRQRLEEAGIDPDTGEVKNVVVPDETNAGEVGAEVLAET